MNWDKTGIFVFAILDLLLIRLSGQLEQVRLDRDCVCLSTMKMLPALPVTIFEVCAFRLHILSAHCFVFASTLLIPLVCLATDMHNCFYYSALKVKFVP